MKSYYSVIYVQTNAAAQDRLAIGMVMIEPDTKQVRYDYSSRKLRLIGELVQRGLKTGLRWSLENLVSFFRSLIKLLILVFSQMHPTNCPTLLSPSVTYNALRRTRRTSSSLANP